MKSLWDMQLCVYFTCWYSLLAFPSIWYVLEAGSKNEKRTARARTRALNCSIFAFAVRILHTYVMKGLSFYVSTWSALKPWASKAGDGGTRPSIKISGGRRASPPKIRMKISNSDYLNGFKLDSFKFHHNLSIVVAILDRTKPIHVFISAIKTHVIPLIRPERDRWSAPPPARNV